MSTASINNTIEAPSMEFSLDEEQQGLTDLAAHFGVSEQAIAVRLDQTGLNNVDAAPTARCARPILRESSSGAPETIIWMRICQNGSSRGR